MWLKTIALLCNILLFNATDASECGVRKVNINKAIVRGQPTSPGDWPWHVAIYHIENIGSNNYVCGGTLICELFVLTADHCIRDDNENVISYRRIFVRVGLHNLNDLNRKTFNQHNVHKVHRYRSTDMLKNGIAILELSTEVEFTDFVQPVCVNQVEDLTRQFGTAVGWGVDETDEISPILKSQQMPVVSTNQCLESNDGIFRSVLDSSIFCAGFLNGTTVCNGDSGGGLHFERNGVWYVGGIVSFTAPRDAIGRCHLKSYAGFTNVHHFLPWICNVTGLSLVNNNAVTSNLLPQDCGRYLANRILGGTNARLYELPWMAHLKYTYKKSGQLLFVCHGSLINKRYILTSASCVIYKDYKLDFIDLGDYDKRQDPDCNVNNASDCAPPVRRYGFESVIAHPQFNSSSQKNDIALIRLDRDVEFEDHIQPICLPVTQSLRQQKLEQYIVAGWDRILQKATVRVIDQSECRSKSDSRFYIGDGVICAAGNGTPNACLWDRGAPLGYPSRYNERVRFVQYGITSRAGCFFPSIYTFVPDYMDWILNNLR